MKLLELFKGTGSVGKVFKELYPNGEIYSVDILKKYNPSFCGDIMTWDYKKFPVGHFDFIWASPECKVYSILQNTWFKTGKRGDKGKWEDAEHLQRVREEHGQFSKRALEIIDYFKPKAWFIENPWASAMKDLTHFTDRPSYRFDYLTPGKYTVFVYSECAVCAGGLEVRSSTVEITEKNQTVGVENLIILN